MQSAWVRDTTSILVKQTNSSSPKIARQLDFLPSPSEIESKEVETPLVAMYVQLRDRCYPAHTTQKYDPSPYPTQNPNSYTSQNFSYYPNSFPFNPPHFGESDMRFNSLEKSIEALLKSQANLTQSQQYFMQTMTHNRQLLNSNTQAISKLEAQVSKLANTINEREKNRFPSQPKVNPKFHLNQKPYEIMNPIISLRLGDQFNNHVSVNTKEEDKLTSESNHLLLSHEF